MTADRNAIICKLHQINHAVKIIYSFNMNYLARASDCSDWLVAVLVEEVDWSGWWLVAVDEVVVEVESLLWMASSPSRTESGLRAECGMRTSCRIQQL